MTRKGAVGTPRYARISLVRPLCSVSASVSGSDPVYGICKYSHSAGTCDSRLGPCSPSAMLKTMSGCASASFFRKELVGFETNDVTEETQSQVDRIDGGWVIPFGVGVGRGARVGFLVVCETYSHVKPEYETTEGCARLFVRRENFFASDFVVRDAPGFLFVVADVDLEV